MSMELTKEARATMDRIAAGLPTKSEKIRALGRAGYARADIARYLGIKYQFVRNVLVQAEEKERQGGGGATERPRRQEWAQVGPEGRVVIPAPYRRLLGIEGGGHLLMLLEDGEVRLVGRDAAIRRARNLVARYVPRGAGLVDELIAERRAEARDDDREPSRP